MKTGVLKIFALLMVSVLSVANSFAVADRTIGEFAPRTPQPQWTIATERNLYQFVYNDPNQWVDPDGRSPRRWIYPALNWLNNTRASQWLGRQMNNGLNRLLNLWGRASMGSPTSCPAPTAPTSGPLASKVGRPLAQKEISAISKINNIINKNYKPGPKGDISGAIHDMVGNPIPKPGGGLYDHVDDLGNMLRGLRNHVETLKNATDPAAVAARQKAEQLIQEMQQCIQGAGL